MKQLTQADQSTCHPQDIGNQCGQDQHTAHDVPILLLEGVHHRHILVLSHRLGKEKATWIRREEICINWQTLQEMMTVIMYIHPSHMSPVFTDGPLTLFTVSKMQKGELSPWTNSSICSFCFRLQALAVV